MNSKQNGRRRFLQGGAALVGMAVSGMRTANSEITPDVIRSTGMRPQGEPGEIRSHVPICDHHIQLHQRCHAAQRGRSWRPAPDEVYALTAFFLFKNGIIQEDVVLDEKSLPKVQMPKRDPRLNGLVTGNNNDK